MDLVIPLGEVVRSQPHRFGNKAAALAGLASQGFDVPETVCIPVEAYTEYLSQTGLSEHIRLEVTRKPFRDMRWEEVWDAALRIRSLFLRTALPADLERRLKEGLEKGFSDGAVVIRSSAPGEDSATASFAGLHESFVNIRGMPAILKHIRLVWASLWSDAALLYRQELGLAVETSAMAVVMQEAVCGERSGVAFSRSPSHREQVVIEAVYGLNQGLVDGAVQPDRWIVARGTGELAVHTSASRTQVMVPSTSGVELTELPSDKALHPPLNERDRARVFELACRCEEVFGTAQDVEWTFRGDRLYVLQSRPVTAAQEAASGDRRGWYRSLVRTFENLQVLRQHIEKDLIPAMMDEASKLSGQPIDGLQDEALADEIRRRSGIYRKWTDVYRADFIPFGHGVRLFGQVYNDAVQPDSPYEFVELLRATHMVSLERNRKLEHLAALIRERPPLAIVLEKGTYDEADADFRQPADEFAVQYGDLSEAFVRPDINRSPSAPFIAFLLEMARRPPHSPEVDVDRVDALTRGFLDTFQGAERRKAIELLDLARASYRLKDDDNIYLHGVESGWLAAVAEGRRRLVEKGTDEAASLRPDAVAEMLKTGFCQAENIDVGAEGAAEEAGVSVRQLIGQPACPGVAIGNARVIECQRDLLSFKHGEVLVCDALSPAMTFAIPLAAGIVERRGGMLIHGAIIAREYGIPCVTGVVDASRLIPNGATITVDGYIGIVRIRR